MFSMLVKRTIIGMLIAAALVIGLPLSVWLGQSLFRDGLDPCSLEGIEARNLRMQRHMWLEDGCPQPPRADEYIRVLSPDTNYTFTQVIVLTNHTYHGLFATRCRDWTNALVITTTGEILAVGGSGQVRFVERARW